MNKPIRSALISVFYKDGLEIIVKKLQQLGVTIYSTGGTQQFIEKQGVNCVPVESLTSYPSILGGRVKTLHPSVFGGILGRRDNPTDSEEMARYQIPEIDLVIVDLYPFEETVASLADDNSRDDNSRDDNNRDDDSRNDKAIIEKIDVGGPSMIRAAAKNHRDVAVIAARSEYAYLIKLLDEQHGETTLEQRRQLAARAFEICAHYDVAIARYFNTSAPGYFLESVPGPKSLRYGENPHQAASYFGRLEDIFEQVNGKELSYNNLVDVDAAVQLIGEFRDLAPESAGGDGRGSAGGGSVFAIIKHTNPCGVAIRSTIKEAWDSALAGDPESAFGGVLACNSTVDKATAAAINEIFFEVLIAPAFDADALEILRSKKNRILLVQKKAVAPSMQYRSLLSGVLQQQTDIGNYSEWKEAGGRAATEAENQDMICANLVCKHLKSNAIALVKDRQLIGKGCGQTSRIDSVRQAIAKAGQFNFDLKGAVLASDAFFPFSDSVQIAHAAGVTAFIQPGGSIRDKDSIDYCVENKLAMVITGMRHFKH
jgi:phosphoribosylaminoimidazolecarboxamide formyltransferase/IMP cyclohydrolase